MAITPCKHCGARDTVRNGYASGSVVEFFNISGGFEEASTDMVNWKMSNVIRCAECNKIRRELVCVVASGQIFIEEVTSGDLSEE